MKRMLVNAAQQDELRVAVTEYNSVKNTHRIIDLDIEVSTQKQKKSNIYKGLITSIEPSLGSVFVDYGSERHGFLPLKEVSSEYFLSTTDCSEKIDIRKVLKEKQELVVQIEKEERGNKGAALTTFISLPGSYLVLMPNNPRAGGISRRIEGEEREHLKTAIDQLNIPEGMSVIVRTAGVNKSIEELQWDLTILLRYWEGIKQAAIAKQGPYLIHQESDVITRAIRDYLHQDIEEIIVDEPNAYKRAHQYLSHIRPDYLNRLKLYDYPLPLFSHFQIEEQIEQAYHRQIHLPSGGSIVIDMTEALVSIDINSAKATKGGNIEETAYNTNVEAAREIARQLRIRDIGGLIVIDFIDMISSKNQRLVETTLREALQLDRARTQIGRISRFGLLEMSRQRLRATLSRITHIPCPRCVGRGTIRGVESMALSFIHFIQEHASRAKKGEAILQVQLPLDVATYLLNEKRNVIKNIEKLWEIAITIIPNPSIQSPQYQIKELKKEQSRETPSYLLIKPNRPEKMTKKMGSIQNRVEPAIKHFLNKESSPPSHKINSSMRIIRQLWEKVCGNKEHLYKTEEIALSKEPKKKPYGNTTSRKQQTQLSSPRDKSNKKLKSKNNTRRGTRGGSRRNYYKPRTPALSTQAPQNKPRKTEQSSSSEIKPQSDPITTHALTQQVKKPTDVQSSPEPQVTETSLPSNKKSTPSLSSSMQSPLSKNEPKLEQITTKNKDKD